MIDTCHVNGESQGTRDEMTAWHILAMTRLQHTITCPHSSFPHPKKWENKIIFYFYLFTSIRIMSPSFHIIYDLWSFCCYWYHLYPYDIYKRYISIWILNFLLLYLFSLSNHHTIPTYKLYKVIRPALNINKFNYPHTWIKKFNFF